MCAVTITLSSWRIGWSPGQGLRVGHVQGRAREAARAQRIYERLGVDEATAGAVDEKRVGLEAAQTVRVDHLARVAVERRMQADESELRDQVVERDQGHAEAIGDRGIEKRVGGLHAESNALGPRHDLLPHVTQPTIPSVCPAIR